MGIAGSKGGSDGGSVDVVSIGAGATAITRPSSRGYHMIADGEGLIKAIIAKPVREDF